MTPIHVDRDGCWSWQELPMIHDQLVPYLKTRLIKDDEGLYWVVDSSGAVPVVVEDAPFVAVRIDRAGEPRVTLEHGEQEPLGTEVTLLMNDQNRLYVPVRGGRMRALLSRSLHHWVWEHLTETTPGCHGLEIDGQLWPTHIARA